jgi:hypothetical protein
MKVIVLCYHRHIIIMVSRYMRHLFTLHISHMIVDHLSHVVSTCVLNQSCDHWMLSDALHFIISMCLKLKEELNNPHC